MRPVRPQPVEIDGPTGRIEALLEEPDSALADAFTVVCHPHPLYHGTMNNKVVHTVSRASNLLRRPALRFNFRGVGDSEGAYDEGLGETEDTVAVIDWARVRWPRAGLWLAGFSFGAYVALRAAQVADPCCLVTVAPPIQRFAVVSQPRPPCPWMIVQGGRDEIVDSSLVAAWAEEARPVPRLDILHDADHFFHGRLNPLRERVMDFLRANSDTAKENHRC